MNLPAKTEKVTVVSTGYALIAIVVNVSLLIYLTDANSQLFVKNTVTTLLLPTSTPMKHEA